MPEYFSPGVYIEEFESGSRPMSGASTSIPGFLGLTAKGHTIGLPKLVTSAAEFKRIYGSYLSKYEYKDFRFLSYAIDLFFANGGAACYVMRVEIPDSKQATYKINEKDSEYNYTYPVKKSQVPIKLERSKDNDTENPVGISYNTNNEDIDSIQIGMSVDNTEDTGNYTVDEMEDKLTIKSKNEDITITDILGNVLVINNGDDDEKYFIVSDAKKKAQKSARLCIYEAYSSVELYGENSFYDLSSSYKITKKLQMQIYINHKAPFDFCFAHVDPVDSTKCVDDLKETINIQVDKYNIDLNLSAELVDNLKHIDKSPMKIIFGDNVDEANPQEIFPKGGGKKPEFAPPVIPQDDSKIWYTNEDGTSEKVYISEMTSIIEGLTIDTEKTVDDKLYLLCTKGSIEDLKGSIVKFSGNNKSYYYSFVKSVGKDDNSVELLRTDYNTHYTDIEFCPVAEVPLGVCIGKGGKQNKLKFLDMLEGTSAEFEIELDDKKTSLHFNEKMVQNLRNMKASPLQIISKEKEPSEAVEINEGGKSPSFTEELPKSKGNIYYTSSNEIGGDGIVKITENISLNIKIDPDTNNSALILSCSSGVNLEEELHRGILKFTDDGGNSYYSAIKSISKKENENNKYSVELMKNIYEYGKLKFCDKIEQVLIDIKLGSDENVINLDFSKICDIKTDTNMIGNKNGVSIFIDSTMKKNLVDMTTSPLKIIAYNLDAKGEIKINGLSGDVEMTFTAVDIGAWGNKVSIIISNSEATKTKFCVPKGTEPSNCFRVKSVQGFNVGDIVAYYKKGSDSAQSFDIITQIKDDMIELKKAQQSPEAGDILATCKLTFIVNYEETSETFEDLVLNSQSADFIDERLKKSNLITVETTPTSLDDYLKDVSKHPFEALSGTSPDSGKTMTIHLNSGSDGFIPSSSDEMIDCFTGEDENADIPGKRKGLNAFLDNEVVSMICIPGVTNALIQDAVINHCEKLKSRIAILDIPLNAEKTADVYAFKDNIHTDYAAVYHPWLEIYDPLEKKKIFVPPSGAVAGIYARSDNQYGVHKAPANEIVKSITGLSCYYNKQEQDFLNPRGINLIRSFSGQGIKIWGARTCSSNTLWKYVNVRRLFIYLEETIKTNTNWIVFEPNNELLWLRVKRTIEVFLDTVWRTGALMGSTPEEAYYVDIGRSTMTQDDIDNGRLICVIGVAPVKPAEFVIFRLTQKTQEN